MQSFSRFQRFGSATFLALSLTAGVAHAQSDICVNGAGGLGGTPTFDGRVEGDVGWNGALRLNLSPGVGSSTAANVQLGIVGSTLWLGLVVTAPTISPDTTVVLGFSPNDGHTANDWRFHISPFDVAPPPDNTANLHPLVVNYWRESATWNTGAAAQVATAGNWQYDGIRIFKLDNNHWEMEFRIPMTTSGADATGLCLGCSASGTFKMYLNVLNTIGGTSPGVAQDVWPAGNIFPAGFITQTTPNPSSWSVGSIGPRAACTGVKLDWSQIGVQDPTNASNIVTNMKRFAAVTETTEAQCAALGDNANSGSNGPANIFTAKPTNTMTTDAKVSVLFRLANWGIPGAAQFSALGTPVPAGCDPALGPAHQCTGVTNNPAAEATVSAGTTGLFNTTTWALNYKQSCFYKVIEHQGIHVDMDSTDANTRFLNKSVERNMDFVPASTYQQKAYVNGNQGPLPSGHTAHRFLLELDVDQDGPIAGGNPTQPPQVPDQPQANRRTADATVKTGGNEGQVPRFHDPAMAAQGHSHFGEGVTNMYQWVARGYLYTGNKIVINGHEYENLKPVGDFGYVAGHKGEISGWTSKFSGERLKPVPNTTNLYTIEVPPGEVATVETVISADETGGVTPLGGNLKWWVILVILGLLLILFLIFRKKSA